MIGDLATTNPAERLNHDSLQSYLRYVSQTSQGAIQYVKECELAYHDYIGTLQGANQKLHELLVAAHQSYIEGLGRAWTPNASQEQCRKNYELYLKAINDLVRPSAEDQYVKQQREYTELVLRLQPAAASGDNQRAAEAVQEYVGALNRIWSRGDAVEQAVNAANAYMGDLREAQSAGHAATLKAYEAYADSLKSAWQQARLSEALDEAFKGYSERVRRAWEELRKVNEEAFRRASEETQQAIDRNRSMP